MSVDSPDFRKAANDYTRALRLNPRLGQAWIGLSDCLDHMGRRNEAEAALEKAFAVQPYSPLIRWQAGNFYLRQQNRPKMCECFKLACR
ncbi:MAG TPA: tetratricopeptide repeat protein [Acidobacteriota bacterium]|nr:tetratricopeptide repeat protein [Acidobacteriota bacterium]